MSVSYTLDYYSGAIICLDTDRNVVAFYGILVVLTDILAFNFVIKNLKWLLL